MPEGSRRAVTEGVPYGKGRKSKKKRYTACHGAPVDEEQIVILGLIPVAPSARVSLLMQQMVAKQPNTIKGLKRVGIIKRGIASASHNSLPHVLEGVELCPLKSYSHKACRVTVCKKEWQWGDLGRAKIWHGIRKWPTIRMDVVS